MSHRIEIFGSNKVMFVLPVAYKPLKGAREHELQFHDNPNYIMRFDRRHSCAYVTDEASVELKCIYKCIFAVLLHDTSDERSFNGDITQQ